MAPDELALGEHCVALPDYKLGNFTQQLKLLMPEWHNAYPKIGAAGKVVSRSSDFHSLVVAGYYGPAMLDCPKIGAAGKVVSRSSDFHSLVVAGYYGPAMLDCPKIGAAGKVVSRSSDFHSLLWLGIMVQLCWFMRNLG